MDLTVAVNAIVGVGAVAVAAVIALVVGRRRGLDKVEAQADGEVARLMDAQAARLTLQDREIAELKFQVASLQQQVASLKSELDVERRISLRFRDAAGDGK